MTEQYGLEIGTRQLNFNVFKRRIRSRCNSLGHMIFHHQEGANGLHKLTEKAYRAAEDPRLPWSRCLNTPAVSSRRTRSICGTVTPVANQWSGSAQLYNTSGEGARPSDRAVFNCPTALTGQTWTYHLSEQHHEIPRSQSPQRPPGLHPKEQTLQRQSNHSFPSSKRHLAGTGRVHHRYPSVRERGGGAALNRSSVNGGPRPEAGC